MRRRVILLPTLAVVSLWLTTALPQAVAANQGNPEVRAANLARMKADILNGGGGVYRAAGLPATVETEVLVSPDGREIRQVVYNGPPRQTF